MKPWHIVIIVTIAASILFVLVLPALVPVGLGHRQDPCMANLRMIQIAKQMYADDYKLTNDVAFSKEQLLPYLGGKWPQCPKSGQYSIGTLQESPRCSYPNHRIRFQIPVEAEHEYMRTNLTRP